MIVGLIDVDMESRGKCTYPNLALMKFSSIEKAQGNTVEWYTPEMGEYDRVYMSKVFSNEYTDDYSQPVYAKEILRGGSGYAITIEDGKEVYHPELDKQMDDSFFRIMPDYSIYEPYGIKNTAYGFLTRGCPRGCHFCHVKGMQGRKVWTVAKLSDFWTGQKKISLLDPNITASADYEMHMKDLAASKARVEFNQGLDIRLLNSQKIKLLNDVRWDRIHFAWDKPEEDLASKFELLANELRDCKKQTVSVYCLTNFGSTFEQDLMRVQWLRKCHVQPYVMIYRKETAPKITRRLQRWVNWPSFFWAFEDFFEWQAWCKDYKEVIYP